MAIQIPTFLIRHGRYEEGPPYGLTEEGRGEMRSASRKLREMAPGIGEGALIMCSSRPRAVQSGEVLSGELGGARMVDDDRLAGYGDAPQFLVSLDALLEEIVQLKGVDLREHDALAVVTHAPLISVAVTHNLQSPGESIPYGGVYPYEPGSWQNPATLPLF